MRAVMTARPWIAPVLTCVLAATAMGSVLSPASEDSATVTVSPRSAALLQRARLPQFKLPALAGITLTPNAGAGRGAAYVEALQSNERLALAEARRAAREYVADLIARQNRFLGGPNASGSAKARAAGRAVLARKARYQLSYPKPSIGAGDASPPLRAALIGLLAGILAVVVPKGMRRNQVLAAVGSAGLVALSSASRGAYTADLLALLFALALVVAWRRGMGGVRTLLLLLVAIAPLRGAALALTDTIDVPNALFSFEAVAPTLIAGCALGALVAHRSALWPQPRLLLGGWVTIAVIVGLDLLTQSVGIKVYVIGVGQYLTYPTLALLAWRSLRYEDGERLALTLAALGLAVAVSIYLENAGVPFTEAALSPAPSGVGIRYGGATGSYLHAAIFLGTTIVLAAGLALARWSRGNAIAASAALGVMLAGLTLTYSRGGMAIAAIGVLVLFLVRPWHDRRRLVLLGLGAGLAAIAVGFVTGPSPTQVASHASAAASVQGDKGNSLRLDAMRKTIDEYKRLSLPQKALGEGVASTGNARKLVSDAPNPTESYPLKLLLEVGALGLLAIGALVVLAVVWFAFTAATPASALVAAVGAAGLGLSAEALIYPTLEVQLIALVWWLLLVLCLKAVEAGDAATPRLPARWRRAP